MPKVSVIMPVYNGAAFVVDAIESVTAQTWQDWELIVVDDGSTDATPGILDRLSDPRIVVVHQENRGAAASRNAALEAARGVYVAFLDADDLYFPNALADLVTYLDTHQQVDVVFSDGYFGDGKGKPTFRLSEHRPGPYTGDILQPLVLSPSVISGIICTMSRRALFEEYEVWFDEDLAIGEDWDFWIQVARHAQFGYLDRLTCVYRVHSENATRTSGLRKRNDDLASGRLKVMDSDWFSGLSQSTRKCFFDQLLVGLLAGQVETQRAILGSEPFQGLPPRDQADLWRRVGVDHLLNRYDAHFGADCLRQASCAWPDERKTRLLLWTLRFGDRATTLTLRFWQALHATGKYLRALGRDKRKPVPAGLRLVEG